MLWISKEIFLLGVIFYSSIDFMIFSLSLCQNYLYNMRNYVRKLMGFSLAIQTRYLLIFKEKVKGKEVNPQLKMQKEKEP